MTYKKLIEVALPLEAINKQSARRARYSGDATRDHIDGFLKIARRSQAGSGARGRTWSRDELHER